jgi:AhpD family alkylhydroperoxidase
MMNPLEAAPALTAEWIRVGSAIDAAVDPKLGELVKIRTSQINGCANCINVHTIEARRKGETEQRLYLLSAWREAPCFTDRERAALAWTEALNQLSEGADHRGAYEILEVHFSEEEQMNLTLLINVIAGFNRIAVGFGLYAEPEHIKRAQSTVAV